MKKIAILLAGRKMVGKTTAAEYVKERLADRQLDAQIYGYAHQIKDVAKLLGIANPLDKLALTDWRLSDLVNELQPNTLDRQLTVREMLQHIGMALRDHLSHGVWHQALWAKMRNECYGRIAIIDDVRLEDELVPPPGFDAVRVRISRPSLPKTDSHVTETEIDNVEPIRFQYEIVNDGSLTDFTSKLDKLVEALLRELD